MKILMWGAAVLLAVGLAAQVGYSIQAATVKELNQHLLDAAQNEQAALLAVEELQETLDRTLSDKAAALKNLNEAKEEASDNYYRGSLVGCEVMLFDVAKRAGLMLTPQDTWAACMKKVEEWQKIKLEKRNVYGWDVPFPEAQPTPKPKLDFKVPGTSSY